ncbi:RNA-binding protein [Candidatus Woesearchaeota archaeon]|nr:RNA-binding protein [Candidatus Woesearchaeota archaeon]MBT6402355.1 RNA-binding protein [Candidatus Woesearchaeota archaeon]
MGELFVKERQIVVPGDKLASGMDYLPAGGAYRDGEEIRSSVVGILGINGRVLRVIALKTHYNPRPGDMVIAKITDMTNSLWFAKVDSFRDGLMTLREVPEYVDDGADLTQFYNFGDYVLAKVAAVGRTNLMLTLKGPGLRKISGGRIIEINSAKVPRVIGKQGSMISLLKDKTGCRIIVGQNGLVWVQGAPEHELVAVDAINYINEKGHLQGLTDKVSDLLDKAMKNVVVHDSEEKPQKDKPKKKTKEESDDEEEAPTRRAAGKKAKKTAKRGSKK